jgi:predicted TIM-barrel fold metal-dependent hydrolase
MSVIDGYTTPGTERETLLSADDLLRQMDAAGVERAVIAPEDREIAVANAAGNRRIAAMAREARGRFIPACTVNPWTGPDGIDELKRAVGEGGARMLILGPALQGFITTDDLCDALLAEAARMNLPVYFHTGPHSSAAPTQVALLAERFPDARFILGHCGSTDYAHDMPSVFRMKLANLWFELSFVRPWSIASYAQQSDESRLIFGSSSPRNDLAFELAQFDEHWPRREHPGTYGGNLLKLIDNVGEVQP